MKRRSLLLAWAAGALLALNGTLLGLTADDVSRKTGISGGLCSFPRVTGADEQLAIELANRPAFVVHLQSAGVPNRDSSRLGAPAPDAAVVAAARDAARREGVLGRSLYAETGPAERLPFADRLVDLLIVTDLRDADLTDPVKSEWLRVLAPRRGTALVGRAKAAPGDGLSQDALKAWTKDLPLAKVIADDTGVWAVLRTELPAGSDAWTHRCHGPDNSQVSTDATLKAPFLTQWWGMPRQEGFWGTTVVAGNGRMFSLRGSRNASEQVFLTARSLTNGLPLWQKLLRQAEAEGTANSKKVPHGGYVPGRSCMVLSGDTLYLADKDGVLVLDAETGAQRDRLAGPKAAQGGQIKWIACQGGCLAVLAGEADIMQPVAYQTVAANPVGRELAVYDIESKAARELWHDTVAGDVDERAIVVRDNRLYFLAQGVGVACRELRTGKAVWSNADTDVQTEFHTPDQKVIGQLLVSQPELMALDDVLLFRAKWAKNLFALSRADGSLLWKKPSAGGSYRTLTAVVVNNLLVGGPGGSIDLKTGQVVKPGEGPGSRFISSGCGPTTGVPGYLITCFGTVLDTKSNKVIRGDDIKSPCDVGSLVAEGMMITVPSECGCYFEVKGYRVLASAGSIQPHTAPAAPWKDRLTRAAPLDSGDAAPPAGAAVTDGQPDWPTYRRDGQRSASSTATVGNPSKILWQWKPGSPRNSAAPRSAATSQSNVAGPPMASAPRLAPDFLATAPVAAAGKVLFASHDGIIHCMNAADGTEAWNFATAGCLFAPPTIWEGRVLAGSGDGRIYCLDAATGRCLWRLQAAPVDRRVFWFGHLVSTWPVVSGVVVQDGVAYAVAGYQKENGIHAYAIDPKSGQVLWEKDDAGLGGQAGPGGGLGSLGQVAVGGGKLWLSSSPAGCFDLKSGDWKSVGGGHFGCEAAVMFDKWVIQGGRRLSETQDTLGRPLGGTGFAASFTDTPAAPPAKVPLTDVGTALPAWDADLVVMPPKGARGPLTAVPTAKLSAWLTDRSAGQPGAAGVKAAPNAPKPKVVDWPEFKSWTTEAITPVAFALAKDQVVAAYTDGRVHRVSGFARTDGSKVWTVDLPDQAAPAMNRLAVDRDGRVIVALCDGSMVCVGRN